MKRALASVLVAGLCITGASTVSFAGANANAKILLHVLPTTSKNPCTRSVASPSAAACNAISFNGLSLYPTNYYAYLLVTDGNQAAGIAGLQCGIQYNQALGAGVDVFTWTNCATLEFSSTGWPASGGGNLITWDNTAKCQRTIPAGNDPLNGVVAVAGYFYMGAYTPDLMRVTPRPVDGQAKVGDCAGNEDLIGGLGYPAVAPSHLGIAAFGQAGGYNPCGLPTPTQATTWSGIKGQYKQ